MAEFNAAFQETMGDEGGYANNPADAGGETYKGIARKFWGAWQGWRIVDQVKKGMTAQPQYDTGSYQNWVKELNRQLAANRMLQGFVLDFFKANFWDKNLLGGINNQTVATWLFNHAVNGGARGIQWMQAAAGVICDGAMGPKTVAAINAADASALLDKAMDNAVAYRLADVKAHPDQKQFLCSWLHRDGVSADKIKAIMETV
jgi:lysozyme family protein